MYPIFNKIREKTVSFLYKLIEIVEKIEYRNLDLNEDDISKKILSSYKTENLKVWSDSGFVNVPEIHTTQPYKIYRIETENGFYLECADRHIIFKQDYSEVFIKDLKIGDKILTECGPSSISEISISKNKVSMFDLSVDHPNHRYYTNGILSHNTISSAIFILHFILFNNDKNIMMTANKGDTVVEVVDKIKNIYALLPFFIKPGIKVWNQKSISFENGCRIKTSARTKSAAVGFSIDLLYMDEFAVIPANIIEPFYTSTYPTVSAIENSKIIITSTPQGMNLFHKILTDAERPAGDPLKNNYKAMRVYWYQVPGRFVTYIKLNNHNMHVYDVDIDDVYNLVNEKWGDLTKVEMKFNLDIQKDVIHIYNNDMCKEDDIKYLQIKDRKGNDLPIMAISEISTWRDEAIKDIGSEDAFNQEYGLRFINSSKSLLNENVIDDLLKGKTNYVHDEIYEIGRKLRFSYEDLLWVEDYDIWNPINRKDYKIVLSVDIAEGLGQDYSVINIFKISEKPKEVIDANKNSYKTLSDFYRLEQVGIYRNNMISVKQLSELLYLIAFEYLNPDNVKIVLELNNYGNTLLAEMPHVFDGNNNYGSSIFFRYKQRADSPEEKIGLKIGDNKNMMVKDYQDLMQGKSIVVNNEDNIREITTFVKHTTSAGNTKYGADGSAHDDTVMTLVNLTSVFKKNDFIEMINEYSSKSSKEFLDYANEILKNSDYVEANDYSQVLKIRRQKMNRFKSNNNFGWFGD